MKKLYFFLIVMTFGSSSVSGDEIDIHVPEDVARFAADSTANNYHQTKSLYKQSVYYGLNDELAAYVYTYTLNASKKSKQIVSDKATVKVDAQDFINTKEQLTILRKQPPKPHLGQKISQDELQLVEQKLRNLQKQMRQRDNYVTIVVSAKYTDAPILDRYFGLPHHEYKQGIMALRAQKQGKVLSKSLKVIFVNPQELYYAADDISASGQSSTDSSASLLSVGQGTITSKAEFEQQVSSAAKKQAVKLINIDDFPQKWKLYRSRVLSWEIK